MAKEPKRPVMCSICHQPIREWPPGWHDGHNANPVNDGRCCDDCNTNVVIPARIARAFRRMPVRG